MSIAKQRLLARKGIVHFIHKSAFVRKDFRSGDGNLPDALTPVMFKSTGRLAQIAIAPCYDCHTEMRMCPASRIIVRRGRFTTQSTLGLQRRFVGASRKRAKGTTRRSI
ncbi:hypothetical protein JI59_04205 [Novosphingobium pentaromativorans US6-1]|nr:hypothetical protein JI59_04205 [Novosphingobium pentaromativorans US6-1]